MSSLPPVFIVGSPRSGATWLYHLLLSSGDFAIYRSESRVFDVIGPRFGGWRRRSDRAHFLSKWLAGELFYRSGLDADDLRARVLDDCSSAGDFLRILMESIAAEQGASRWAECTPTNAFYPMEDYDRVQRCAIGSVARPNTSFGTGTGGPTFNPVERWRSSSADTVRAIEALVGRTLEELGYVLHTDRTQLELPALDRWNRLLYRLGFSGRMWAKSQTPLGRWFVDTSILEGGWGGDSEDKTLRPGEHKEHIRSLVGAGVS